MGRFIFHLSFSFTGLAALTIVAGCGDNDRLPTSEVRGRVLIDDRPLAGAQVTFTPEKGRAATAKSESDGSYELGTYGNGDGAIVGHHRVTVVAREPGVEDSPGAPMMVRPGRTLIPAAYSNPATSQLEFNVVTDKENVFDIRLSSKKK